MTRQFTHRKIGIRITIIQIDAIDRYWRDARLSADEDRRLADEFLIPQQQCPGTTAESPSV